MKMIFSYPVNWIIWKIWIIISAVVVTDTQNQYCSKLESNGKFWIQHAPLRKQTKKSSCHYCFAIFFCLIVVWFYFLLHFVPQKVKTGLLCKPETPEVRCKMQPIVTFYNTATWWWEVAFSYLCVQPPQPWVRLFSAPWDSVCPERSQRSQVQCDLKRQIQYADLSQQYLLKCTHLCLCCWYFNLIWFNYGHVLHFWLPFMVTRASLGT